MRSAHAIRSAIRELARDLPADYRTPGSHTRRLILENRAHFGIILGAAVRESLESREASTAAKLLQVADLIRDSEAS